MPIASHRTQAGYRSRINRVMDYIETRLASEFTLAELADVACFSKYHFNRIFHAVTGETLFGFIQRIRVEKAATMLIANPRYSVTQIAFDCGFNSASAFARCFREHFEVSATEWREHRSCTYQRQETAGKTPDPVAPELVRVTPMADIPLAYVRYTGPYEGDGALFARLYDKLFSWAGPRDLLLPDTRSLIVYHDSIDITDADRLRVSVCISVPPDTRGSGPVSTMTLTGGKYACARFRLNTDQYYQAWQWVFARWLPDSGFQPGDTPCFESYPFAGNETGNPMTVDICVPVIPI